jgi:enoyl-CoA hydratase/carnithine racemase
VAAQHGLVNRLVADETELDVATHELVARIAVLAPLVITALKTELGAMTDPRPMNPDVFENLLTRRQAAWRSEDYVEGIRAFRERRAPDFQGR